LAKFKFSLEKVLLHREMLEDLAQKDFHQAMAFLNAEKDKLDFLLQQKHQAFQTRFDREVQGGQASSSLTQVHEFLKGQDVRIERQGKKIKDIEKQVEELREVLRLKAVETKIIEGLRDRKKDEFVTSERKLEQKRQDDLSTSRFKKGPEKE